MPRTRPGNKRSTAPERGAKQKTTRPVTADSQAHRADRRAWVCAVVLAAVTLAVYFPVVRHPFVNYDDPDYVTDNPRVQQGLTGDMLIWAVTSTYSGNWHPLTWLSHALDWELYGQNPAGHHFTSLALHALNACLLFLLLWKATQKTARSLVVAGLFALHPINVECVAWVAERKSVLSMFFFLLTLAAYGWYVQKKSSGRYFVVIALFVLALAAKPMVVTLPFVLLLVDIWPLQRISQPLLPVQPGARTDSQISRVEAIREKLPLIALTVASCVITVIAQHRALKTIRAFPLGARVVNAVFSYVMYLGKAFWPAHLSVFYSPQGSRLAAWQVVLTLAFLAAVSGSVWRLRSHRYLLVGWLWFLGTLVPMIGLVQVGEQGMADRYAYLPFLGIFVAVVWGLADLALKWRIDRRWAAVAAGAALVALSVLTRLQLRSWESSFAMWTHSLQISPENYVAEDFVGATLSEEAFRASGQNCPDQAMVHFQNAIRINSEDALGQLDFGFCLLMRGRPQEALEHYKAALESAPNKYLKSRAYLNLSGAYQELKDFAAARESFTHGAEMYPNDPDILNAGSRLDAEEKIAQLSQAAAAHPTADAYLHLGQLQQQTGHIQDARASYQRALDLDPKQAQARSALNRLQSSGP